MLKTHICKYLQKNIVALQARIHTVKFIRAYPGCLRKRISASLTVEAALVLPLLLFMGVSLIAPVKMIDEKRRIQNEMEASAKDIAQAMYAEKVAEDGGFLNEENPIGEFITESAGGFAAGITEARILSSLNRKVVKRPMFTRSSVSDDGIIDFELSYDMRLPFEVLGISDISMESRVFRRAWTGSEGGRGRDEYGGSSENGGKGDGGKEDEDRDNITVYVGKTGTRYHIDKNCHYLSNKLKAVSGSSVDGLRNESGGKYRPCSSCKPSKSGTVYVLPSGNAYHGSESCKAIGAYEKEVKLKDVKHLGPCSYCSGG